MKINANTVIYAAGSLILIGVAVYLYRKNKAVSVNDLGVWDWLDAPYVDKSKTVMI